MQQWMVATIKDLQLLEQRRMAVGGYNIQISKLDADMEALKGLSYDSTPVQGSGNRTEARIARWMAKKERLEKERDWLADVVRHTEECLARLPNKEREVLSAFYLSQMTRGEAVRALEEKLYCGNSEVYRIRERAINKMAMMLGYV